MNSAPAVLRTPAIAIESASTPVEEPNDFYPWAAYTPEPSPRLGDVVPKVACLAAEAPMQLTPELLQTVCAPYLEQMCRTVQMDPFVQKMPADMITHDTLQPMCKPFFEQMITALQQTLEQQSLQQMQGQHFNVGQSMQTAMQPMSGACFQPVFYPAGVFYRMDEESTEAGDSCAFASLLSPSSEGEGFDTLESKFEDTSDVEKSAMVCRHWKSKGWCRMESKCKFLHPEHKCGVSAPGACLGASADGTESSKRKKRGGKNKSRKGPREQLSVLGQEVTRP